MTDSISKSIGLKLRALRKAQYPNDSQSDFAARIKTSSRTYSRMESGDASVSLKNFINAAEILNVAERLEVLFDHPQPQAESIEAEFSDIFKKNKG